MKIPWERFGAKLGVGVCLAGFALLFLGWNGAASFDRVQSQIPYLISGGLSGLAVVVVGAALIMVEAGREDRAKLRDEITELRAAIDRMGAAGTNGQRRAAAETKTTTTTGPFVAGRTSYHLPTCRLLEGSGELPRVDQKEVAKRGLVACRLCEPAGVSTPRSRPAL